VPAEPNWAEQLTAIATAVRAVGRFKAREELVTAFQGYVASDALEAYVLYRELDYFEQLAALENRGAFDFELIGLLLGRTLVERWEMWRPAVEAAHGEHAYPMFEALAAMTRAALEDPSQPAG